MPRGSPILRGSGGFHRRLGWAFAIASVSLLIVIPLVPPAHAEVILSYSAAPSVGGHPPLAPLGGRHVNAHHGRCTATAVGSVAPGSARGSLSIAEAIRCPSGTRLVFAPALTFTNGLANVPGTSLKASLHEVAFTGDTAMASNVQLYLENARSGKIVTSHLTIRHGVVIRPTTSYAIVRPGPAGTLGVGIRMTLRTPTPNPSSMTLDLVLDLEILRGGHLVGFSQEWIAVTFTY